MASRTTTGFGLSGDDALRGMVDYGLFSEKVQPCFRSSGLTDNIPTRLRRIVEETDQKRLKSRIKQTHDYVRYESLRDINVPRQIGIPHPESYVVQCLALRRHWTTVKQHCAKPDIPVSRTYVQRISSQSVFVMNYKGPYRFEYEEEDLHDMAGPRYVVRADISNCFPSVYTHSIPWAIHGRSKAKGNHSVTLAGNLLDSVTRNTRDGQTNGLLIGPHASNVLSEIILTCVDHQMIRNGYKAVRHIDDYVHYASTYSDAENFIRELALQLREYELVLNERKTTIQSMPVPLEQDWVRELRLFGIRGESNIPFSEVRTFLDSALKIAQREENSAVLNYAIKMVPKGLNRRAKRMFLQYAVNLAILYPYLAPLLDIHVIERHGYTGQEPVVREFLEQLMLIGLKRVYPDAIAHSLYYAIKFGLSLDVGSCQGDIFDIDDCLSLVLLFEYAQRHGMSDVERAIRVRANRLKGADRREQDRYWPLIYQVWSDQELSNEGQQFLAELKRKHMRFLRFV